MEENKTILVTGGAGYIGTNIVKLLLEKGYNVVVIDNLSNSYFEHIKILLQEHPQNLYFISSDIQNEEKLDVIFSKFNIDAVIHLAGKKYIPESFEKEEEYNENNIMATEILLKVMTKYSVDKIIFASSITVYGKTEGSVSEDQVLSPLSPYARTKVVGEELVFNWANQNEGTAIVLRLSNPIGAGQNLGDHSKNENYKNVLNYMLDCIYNNNEIKVNGNTHPTPDGTTVRDYVHVKDVAKSFVNALHFEESSIFNIGTGKGVSVAEIIKELEFSTGTVIKYTIGDKREGDIPMFISNNSKAKEKLGLEFAHSISDMVNSQTNFYKSLNFQNDYK